MNINYISKVLTENNMIHRLTQNAWGGNNINLTHNFKSYRIEIDEDNSLNLLEFNLVNNKRHKNRYHLVDTFGDVKIMVDFIKNRFMLKKAI